MSYWSGIVFPGWRPERAAIGAACETDLVMIATARWLNSKKCHEQAGAVCAGGAA